MNLEEGIIKVEKWSRVRGIYEQSTEAHQQAKTLEEIGEVLTAETIKDQMIEIGDVAICIINCVVMNRGKLELSQDCAGHLGHVAQCVVSSHYSEAISILYYFCQCAKYDFSECLKLAWDKIEHRKGEMIDKFYVKYESMSEEQQIDYDERHADD